MKQCTTKQVHNSNERMQLILSVSDNSILSDICLNNRRNLSLIIFWPLQKKKSKKCRPLPSMIAAMLRTAEGKIILNMLLAVSARQLHEICVKETKNNCIKENTPLLSRFRFQFWPKKLLDKCCCELHRMYESEIHEQQRYIRKFSPDNQYCAPLYAYVRCLAVQFKEYSAFVSMDDECKIKCKQVLVARGTVCQAPDHDMTCITLVPTIVLTLDIPDNVDKSWYRGIPHVYLTITATKPSSALRNTVEIENVLHQNLVVKRTSHLLSYFTLMVAQIIVLNFCQLK